VTMKAEIYKNEDGTEIEITDVPDEYKDLAEEYRDNLIEKAADFDEDLMMAYLEGEEISEEMLKKAIRKGTLAVGMTPVTCGSSYKNKGVQLLLDAIIAYLPSPLDIPPVKGSAIGSEDEDLIRKADD